MSGYEEAAQATLWWYDVSVGPDIRESDDRCHYKKSVHVICRDFDRSTWIGSLDTRTGEWVHQGERRDPPAEWAYLPEFSAKELAPAAEIANVARSRAFQRYLRLDQRRFAKELAEPEEDAILEEMDDAWHAMSAQEKMDINNASSRDIPLIELIQPRSNP